MSADIKKQVLGHIQDLEGATSLNKYLNGVLEITYLTGTKKEFKGVELLMTFGGPNIYVNTRYNQVEGYWGGTNCTLSFKDKLGLNDYFEEMWESVK